MHPGFPKLLGGFGKFAVVLFKAGVEDVEGFDACVMRGVVEDFFEPNHGGGERDFFEGAEVLCVLLFGHGMPGHAEGQAVEEEGFYGVSGKNGVPQFFRAQEETGLGGSL